VRVSLDLDRSMGELPLCDGQFLWRDHHYPLPDRLRPRGIVVWLEGEWQPLAQRDGALYQLVATPWGTPTFEIDGIKMLVSADRSPWQDAAEKVALVAPAGREILDCCGGLGYFAAWALALGATRIDSWERSEAVLRLRQYNPWSPVAEPPLYLHHGDIAQAITSLGTGSVDAILHDPPRFSIAGELYSLAFYQQLARVCRRGGRLFHYTGAPQQRSRGRDLKREVATRLDRAGFIPRQHGDGVVAIRR
jgi:uncharacterized protein